MQLLVEPLRGELLLDGAPMRRDVLATRRRLAAAFQDPLLLTGSVLHNVEVGQGFRRVPRGLRRERALRWLNRFGVGHLAQRHARGLSGGEARRVSLARAFALEPEVLLLDEPFSALDAPTRTALIDDFAAIVRGLAVTTVLVTHDRDEALRLGDQIVVLIDGTVRQVAPPAEVFGAPVDEAVAAVVGVENVWPARLAAVHAAVHDAAHDDGVAVYDVAGHHVQVAAERPPPAALLCLRPEEITLLAPDDHPAGSARNRLPVTVREITPAGGVVRLRLALERAPGAPQAAGATGATAPTMVATITRPSLEALGIDVGSPVVAMFKATAAHLIPQAAGSDA